MPETSLTANIADASAESFKWSDTGVAVTMAAIDNANGNLFAAANDALVIVHNPTGGALTFEMTSQPLTTTGRSGDVSQSLAAGEIRVFRVTKEGWQDADGNVLIPTGVSASLEIGIVKLR